MSRDCPPTHQASQQDEDQSALLLQVVQRAAAFTRAEACLLVLLGEDGQARVAASVGPESEAVQAFAAPLDDRICEQLRQLLRGRPEDRFFCAFVDRAGHQLGVLAALRRADTPAEDARELEAALVSSLADQAAVALEHSARSRRAEQAADAAAAAEQKFRSLLETTPDPIIIVDRDARIILINGEAERCFGFPRQELLGQEVSVLIPERFRANHARHHVSYFANPQLRPMGTGLELWARRADGSEFPVEVSLGPLETPEGVLVTVTLRDVTERKLAEEERARLLESEHRKSEQLILAVREAHHRIKNNLQAVTDLLSLELAVQPDGHDAEMLRDSIERIQAIALVHDLLSHDRDVEYVDTAEVVRRLVPQVLQSTGLARSSVQVTVEAVSVPLASKKATTLALILNELVSNAAKHAFAKRTSGTLGVHLARQKEDLLLTVSDDGPGLPDGFDLGRHSNVGMQVVMTLAQSDLRGRLSLTSRGGLEVAVRFPA